MRMGLFGLQLHWFLRLEQLQIFRGGLMPRYFFKLKNGAARSCGKIIPFFCSVFSKAVEDPYDFNLVVSATIDVLMFMLLVPFFVWGFTKFNGE